MDRLDNRRELLGTVDLDLKQDFLDKFGTVVAVFFAVSDVGGGKEQP